MSTKKRGLKIRLRSGETLAHALVNAIATRDLRYVYKVLANLPVNRSA